MYIKTEIGFFQNNCFKTSNLLIITLDLYYNTMKIYVQSTIQIKTLIFSFAQLQLPGFQHNSNGRQRQGSYQNIY